MCKCFIELSALATDENCSQNGGRSSMVERRVVAPEAVGSSPIVHPIQLSITFLFIFNGSSRK